MSGQSRFWDPDYQKPRAALGQPFPPGERPAPERHSSPGACYNFAFPSPVRGALQSGPQDSLGARFPYCSSPPVPTDDISSYVEPAADSGLLTPTASESAAITQANDHNQAETLSQLDPFLHPALQPPARQSSPPPAVNNDSLVLSSHRTAAANSAVISIHASGEVASQQLQGVFSFTGRLNALEQRVLRVEQELAIASVQHHQASFQKSLDTQTAVLTKLCSGIENLAAASTNAAANAAEAASATVSASSSLTTVATTAAAAAAVRPPVILTQASQDSELSAEARLAKASLEVAVKSLSHGGVCIMKGIAKVANEADVVVALLCHKILLSDFKSRKSVENGQPQYLTLRSAKRGGLFLLAVEMLWMMSEKAVTNMPETLGYFLNPVFKPIKFCTSYVRWFGWLAFSYLAVRSLQQGCSEISRLASLPTPTSSPRAPTAEKSAKSTAAVSEAPKKKASATESEMDAAVAKALSPQAAEKCPHCKQKNCHQCCGGAGSPEKPKGFRRWRKGKKDKEQAGKGDEGTGKEEKGGDDKKEEKAGGDDQEGEGKSEKEKVKEDVDDGEEANGFVEDLDVAAAKAGAKALKTVYKAVGTAGVWLANGVQYAVN